jgi:hypothetical protein
MMAAKCGGGSPAPQQSNQTNRLAILGTMFATLLPLSLTESPTPPCAVCRATQASALATLQLLISAEWDRPEIQRARKLWMVQLGAVGPLAGALLSPNCDVVRAAAASLRRLSPTPGFFAALTGD